jgi:hypothetical protein
LRFGWFSWPRGIPISRPRELRIREIPRQPSAVQAKGAKMPNGRIVNRAIHCHIVTSGGSPVEIEDTVKVSPKAINPKMESTLPGH